METETLYQQPQTHHGRSMRRMREVMGVTQETIALELGITQPAVWKLEQKEVIDDETLKKVADILKVPVDAIKNYREDSMINFIANTFNETGTVGYNSNSTNNNYCTFNPFDKIVELYERLLEAEREKNNPK